MGAIVAKARGLSSAEALLSRLIGKVEETRDTARWSGGYGEEVTGAALEALARLRPDSPLIPKAFRYLMTRRKAGAWETTLSTAQILIAAMSEVRRLKAATADFTATVVLNGKPVGRIHLERASMLAHPDPIKLPLTALGKGQNRVRLEIQSGSRLYYSVVLDQDIRMTTFAAASAPDFDFKREFFTVSPQRLEDGSTRQMPSGNPVEQARSGQILRCRLTFKANKDVSDFVAEVPMPSNLHIVDEEEPLDGLTWQWWWSRSVFTDDKAVIFGSLEANKPAVADIAVRAEAPGRTEGMPAVLYRMYQPDQRALTGSYRFEVLPR
jgi:uncharacterized protein YfaS (alpha-2-macroglobulin family)